MVDVLRALGGVGDARCELLPIVYDDMPVALHRLARYSLLAHVQKLREERRVDAEGEAGLAQRREPGRRAAASRG